MVSFCVTYGAEMQATLSFWRKWGTKTNQSNTTSSMSTGASPQKGTMSLEIFRSSKKKNNVFSRVVKNKPCQQRTLLKTSTYNKIVTITWFG